MQFELILAVLLVVLVIYMFLRDLRATLIPSLSVPLSLIGTFAIMYLAGYSPQQPVTDGPDDRDRLRGR